MAVVVGSVRDAPGRRVRVLARPNQAGLVCQHGDLHRSRRVQLHGGLAEEEQGPDLGG